MVDKWEELTTLIGDLEEQKVLHLIDDFLSNNPVPADVEKVVKACQMGMAIVGDRFDSGEYFVGDLIFAGEILQEAIEKLKPALTCQDKSSIFGKIVLGTVQGDIHDIGKNIFKTMVEAAGFEVIDLGIDVSAEAFANQVKVLQPDIVGMSGVITLALKSMQKTVELLENEKVRGKVKVIIGGACVTKESSEYIGADYFTTNAAEGVKICQEWIRSK